MNSAPSPPAPRLAPGIRLCVRLDYETGGDPMAAVDGVLPTLAGTDGIVELQLVKPCNGLPINRIFGPWCAQWQYPFRVVLENSMMFIGAYKELSAAMTTFLRGPVQLCFSRNRDELMLYNQIDFAGFTPCVERVDVYLPVNKGSVQMAVGCVKKLAQISHVKYANIRTSQDVRDCAEYLHHAAYRAYTAEQLAMVRAKDAFFVDDDIPVLFSCLGPRRDRPE